MNGWTDGWMENLPSQLNQSELSAINHSKIRKFTVPKINFRAKTYPDLFDWHTEPPFTASFSDDQIRDFTPLTPPAFSCHTQAVERGIRLVTEAASSVFGSEERDGFIRQRIKSREEDGRLDT